MIVVIFGMAWFSWDDYTLVSDTTSQLGAQYAPNAWVMNFTFILLGIGSILAGWTHYSGYIFHRVVLLVFGLSLAATAIFHHAPLDPQLEVDHGQDALHSFFASLTGFSFTLLAVATAFITSQIERRRVAIIIGLAATLLSIMMFTLEEWRGLWQRMIFLSAFGWMIWEFGKNRPD
jgi:hypothetical membrane protein